MTVVLTVVLNFLILIKDSGKTIVINVKRRLERVMGLKKLMCF